MSETRSGATPPVTHFESNPFQVNSNKISEVLAQHPTTTLAEIHHVRLTSTPGDDLAEEDFADRVRSLLESMTSLVSLTICIPTMARLHPSNSLPKVLDILRDAATLHPQCRLGLVVHEAEQAWGALTILNRIVEMRLILRTIEFSRAFFPVEALIEAARACGLEGLTLNATQVFSSDKAGTTDDGSREEISTLTSLTVHAHSEASPGLDFLLHTAAGTLTHLDLSSSSSSSNNESSITLHDRAFPHLAQLILQEHLLAEATEARIPSLQSLTIPKLTQPSSCDAIPSILHSSPHIQHIHISHIVAGSESEALARLGQMHPSISITIGELAVRSPASVTPAALAISEHLINAGPPIAEDWPLGFEGRSYPRLKSIVLKVLGGRNHEGFIKSLDAPNLESEPNVTVIGKKKGEGGKR